MTLGVTSSIPVTSLYGGEARTVAAGAVALKNNAMTSEAKAFDRLIQNGLADRTAGVKDVDAGSQSGENGFFTFIKTVIDVINPLQHIPVISTIYRAVTGDEISPAARLAGDTLYGGAIGAAMGAVNIAAQEVTGKDVGDNVLALATSGQGIKVGDTPIAQNVDSYFKEKLATATPAQDPIVWTTPEVSMADATKFPARTGPTPLDSAELEQGRRTTVQGKEPVTKSYPLSSSEIEAKTEEKDLLRPTAPAVESLSALQQHDAPADQGRTPPPELIAAKMMEALDKYGAMKKNGLQPSPQDYPMF